MMVQVTPSISGELPAQTSRSWIFSAEPPPSSAMRRRNPRAARCSSPPSEGKRTGSRGWPTGPRHPRGRGSPSGSRRGEDDFARRRLREAARAAGAGGRGAAATTATAKAAPHATADDRGSALAAVGGGAETRGEKSPTGAAALVTGDGYELLVARKGAGNLNDAVTAMSHRLRISERHGRP